MVSDVLSAPSTKKSARVTPTLSVALAVTATLPETVVPLTGAVTYATGAVVSLPDVATVTVTELVAVAVRPSVACALTLRVCAPSLSVVVSSVPLGSPLNW